MDILLEPHNSQHWIMKKIENINKPIMNKESKSVIKNPATKKSPDQMVSLVNSNKYLKKN